MLGTLSSLTGGGFPTGGGPSSARTGDASAGLQLDFGINNAFVLGGSGKQKVDATASTADGGVSGYDQNMLAYVAIGTAVLVLLATVFIVAKR